jgi:hypothetical protein
MKDDVELFGRPYLGDPRLDRMMGVLFSLAGEVAVLRSQVARLTNAAADGSAIDADMQAFAREILKPLVDPDFDGTPPRG